MNTRRSDQPTVPDEAATAQRTVTAAATAAVPASAQRRRIRTGHRPARGRTGGAVLTETMALRAASNDENPAGAG